MRVIEILGLGNEMRREAERSSMSINESHFMVHQVMLRAFKDDPKLTASGALQAELTARLKFKLKAREIGHCVSP
jgi:hypothetical protein